MKQSGACPKCACTKLWVVDEVRQPQHDAINLFVPFNVTTVSVPGIELGTAGNEYRAEIGTFEAWICSACGLTEWYARDVNHAFEELARRPGAKKVRVVERPSGAYR